MAYGVDVKDENDEVLICIDAGLQGGRELTSVFPQISETSECLHVRALLTSRLDLVLLAVSSGRYHFWILHMAMQRFSDTMYAVPKNLPTADLMRDRRMPASIPITSPRPNLASVPQLMGG